MNDPAILAAMLGAPPEQPRTIAVIGLSNQPHKPSYTVSRYMQQHGYRILPINPALLETSPNATILGEPVYASLADLPCKPDVVNVFRLPQHIPPIVEEMIRLRLKHLWVQLGICNEQAAAQAEAAGIDVVMDRCLLIEHQRLGL